MKIDFELLDRMAEAGATAQVIITMLKAEFERDDAKKAKRRPADKVRKQRKRADSKRTVADKVRTSVESERMKATVADTPRARLFREGKPALLTMNVADSRAGALIVGWLKLTNDDDQLVIATILRAQSMAVADAPSWILATLKGKTNGNGTGANRTDQTAGYQQSGSAAIVAGVAAAAERRGRERAAARPGGAQQGNADAAREPDFEFNGAPNG